LLKLAPKMAFFFTKIVRNVVLFVILLNGIQWYLRSKSYTISAKEFKQISANAADPVSLNAISSVTSGLRRRYTTIPAVLDWVPLSAGGLHLKAQFLYGDLTEYIAIFTSAGPTSGRSGIHWSNSTCTVLSGEVTRYPDAFSSSVKEVLSRGKNFRHGQLETFVYYFAEDTAVACYGRGFIPASSYWTITGALATGDPWAAVKLFYAYGRLTFDGVLRGFKDATDYVKNKASKLEL